MVKNTPPLRAAAALALAGLALGGCQRAATPVEVWPLGADSVRARLGKADVAGLALALRCHEGLDIAPAPAEADRLSWTIRDGFNQIGSFGVRISAQGPQATHTDIDIPADPAGGELLDEAHLKTQPLLKAPLRAAVTLMLRAALEQRSFDARELPGGLPDNHLCGGNGPALAAHPAPASAPVRLGAPSPVATPHLPTGAELPPPAQPAAGAPVLAN